MRLRLLGFAVAAMVGFSSAAIAQNQQQPPTQSQPKTKLEAFTGETGVVMVKGYTDVGAIQAQGRVTVTAMTFRSAQDDQQRAGIVVAIKGGGTYDREGTSYIDLDEVDGLLKGIDYIAKADNAVTKLKNFEAIYSTKGDLKLTVFSNSQGGRSAAIQSGTYGPATAWLTMDQLQKLRGLIVAAREALDKAQ